MSQAFLQRYYDQIDANLLDSGSSERFPNSRRYSNLFQIDTLIFNSLQGLNLIESNLGFATAEITLVNGQEHYSLPDGFRKFLRLVKLDSRGNVTAVLRSKQYYQRSRGVEILSGTAGFRITPPPIIEGTDVWTLEYNRGPGLLHYAKAARVTANALVGGTPGKDAGEFVLKDDYYNGMEVRIYQAGLGAPQTRPVSSFKAVSRTFNVRFPWDTVEGEIWYEIVPSLPEPHDGIFAYDGAIMELPRRGATLQKRRELNLDRERFWKLAKGWAIGNVADRGPERIRPFPPDDGALVYGHVPFSG